MLAFLNQQLTGCSATGVNEKSELPRRFELEQNYPNPFNPSTVISFQLPVDSEVSLVIYSLTGQFVRHVARGKFANGRHQVVWDGRDDRGRRVASGTYFYQITSGNFKSTKRMLVLK
jgi:flagellar hook assembly protein FlgD